MKRIKREKNISLHLMTLNSPLFASHWWAHFGKVDLNAKVVMQAHHQVFGMRRVGKSILQSFLHLEPMLNEFFAAPSLLWKLMLCTPHILFLGHFEKASLQILNTGIVKKKKEFPSPNDPALNWSSWLNFDWLPVYSN